MELDNIPDLHNTCSFTGYRPSKLPILSDKDSEGYKWLYGQLKEEIEELIEKGVCFFQTGMAQGVDLLCAEIVIELQLKYNIHLFAAIPCLNQTNGWSDEDKERYEFILGRCSGITNITDKEYTTGCMNKRNRFLVETAQYILAVYDGKKGGTMSTVNYAIKQKRTIIILNPTDFTRTELIHGNDQGVLYV